MNKEENNIANSVLKVTASENLDISQELLLPDPETSIAELLHEQEVEENATQKEIESHIQPELEN